MPTRFRPSLEAVEVRLTPAFPTSLPDGVLLIPDPAGGGLFRVVNPGDGTDLGDVTPFPGWAAGEVRAATLSLPPNFTPDLVVGAGPGGAPRVRVFDGKTGAARLDFFAYEDSFRGGVYVAAADLNQDGIPDIIAGAGEGGAPRVRVFDGRDARPIADFVAYEESFRGGVRVAAGDVTGDGRAELVVGAGVGGAPRVIVFSHPVLGPGRPNELVSFFAYDSSVRGGVSVAVGGDVILRPTLPFGRPTIIPARVVTVPGVGGGPHVRTFNGATGAETASFFVGDTNDRGGLTLSANSGGVGPVRIVVGFSTPTGPSLVGVAADGDPVGWVRPTGSVRTNQVISSVDLSGRVVNFVSGGSVAVRPDTVLRIDYKPATLDAFAAGDAVVSLVGPAGQLLGLDG